MLDCFFFLWGGGGGGGGGGEGGIKIYSYYTSHWVNKHNNNY